MQVIDCPVCRQEMSPIENVQHIMNHNLRQRWTVEQIKIYIKQEWEIIPLFLYLNNRRLQFSVLCFVRGKDDVSHKKTPAQSFSECLAGVKFRMSNSKNAIIIILNSKYLVFLLCLIEYKLKWICKSLSSVFIYT